jgi:hypothetical protein
VIFGFVDPVINFVYRLGGLGDRGGILVQGETHKDCLWDWLEGFDRECYGE